jgi:hypothetical protein
MSISRIHLIIGVALTMTAAAPALAQSSGRYATDPDPFVWSQMQKEHLALSHSDAVLPRTTLTRADKAQQAGASTSSRYATDPDRNIYGQLAREHLALDHTDAVLSRSSSGAMAFVDGVRPFAATDPDVRIRSMIARERNVF